MMKILEKLKKSELSKYIALSVLTYLLFFWQLLSPNYTFWGSDAQRKFFPTRIYLYEQITKEFHFPFWTEKIFAGFPIYADPEHSYLHPLNVLFILIFGPITSYEILHFIYYLTGSICFYYFLKRKEVNLLGAFVANLIFYFNMFMLNHQIHFTIIMSIYLLPAVFLLLEKFLESRKFVFLFLQSLILVNTILWGHLQSTIILSIGIFLYILFFGYKKIPNISIIKYLILVPLIAILLSLFQLLPSYKLYLDSYRQDGFDFRFGTFSKSLFLSSFVPYLLGTQENKSFIGSSIGTSVTYTEVYIYFGISTLILFIFILLTQKKTKDFYFTFTSIFIYLIFIFIGYVWLIFDNFPILSIFRYWIRFLIIPLFGISVLIGRFLTKPVYEINLKSLIFSSCLFISFILFIQGIFFISFNEDKYLGIFNYLTPSSLLNVYPFRNVFFSIIFLILILIFLKTLSYYYSKEKFIVINYLIVLTVLFDLYYFSYDVNLYRIKDFKNDLNLSSTIDIPNTRIIDLTVDIQGNEYLYLKSNSPFGYSQLRDQKYMEELLESGIKGAMGGAFVPNFEELKDLGITKLKDIDGKVIDVRTGFTFPVKNKIQLNNLVSNDSSFSFEIEAPKELKIETFLKYNPNWVVLVNNQKVPTFVKDYMLFFNISAGNNLIKIYYFPSDFYLGLLLTILFLVPILYLLIKKRDLII